MKINSVDTQADKSSSKTLPLSFQPSPVNREYLKNKSIVPRKKATSDWVIPTETKYDLRDYGYVSPMRDQNPYGTCWTFSAMASLESSTLKQGTSSADFSEKHLAYFGYTDINQDFVAFDRDDPAGSIYDEGGNSDKAIALLSRWTGAVSETVEPYSDMGPCKLEPWLPAGTPPVADVANIFVPDSYLYAPGGDSVVGNIKYLVKNYGAVDVSIFYEDTYYNSGTYAFYNGVTTDSNHAVTVVGWDDSYSRLNFKSIPARDGAWIMRNSWGIWWGDEGYFYVSYEDKTISDSGGSVFVSRKAESNEVQYLYDPLGQTATRWIGVSEMWNANIFSATGSHMIKQVELAVLEPENNFTFYIYKNVNANDPSSGTLVYQSQTLSYDTPGLYIVDLSSRVPVSKGDRFSVVVKTASNVTKVYYALEQPIPGYSSKATALAGQSFISYDGDNWNDITTNGSPECNLCIRAIAVPGGNAIVPVNSLLLLN